MRDEDGDDALACVLGLAGGERREIEALRPYLHLVVLETGDALHREGEPADALSAVVSGRLARRDGDGSAADYGPGDWIGAAAFLAGEASPATVTAIRESVILQIAREDFPFALAACPALWRMLRESGMLERGTDHSIVRKPPRRLAVLKAGEEHRLGASLADALTSAFERHGEIRFIGSGSFGAGMPGAINLDTPQAQHWLQEQELEFDLTIIPADLSDEVTARQTLAEADEILILAEEADLPGLEASPFVEHAFATRGRHACRLAILPAGKARGRRAASPPPMDCRSRHVLATTSADGFEPLARLILGKAASVAAVSSGAHAAAIWGALHAMDEAGLTIGALGGAGSAAFPLALLARAGGASRMAAAFEGLAQAAAQLRRPTRPDYGLFDPRPLDEFFVSALPDLDIAHLEMPFLTVLDDLSARSAELFRAGKVRGLVRSGILAPGVLPPVIIGSGKILVSGETRPDLLARHMGAANPGPLFILEAKSAPLGPSSLGYRDLLAAPTFRLPGRSQAQPADPRLALESQLCELASRRRAPVPSGAGIVHWHIPVPEGVTPLDWHAWRALHDTAYEWAAAQIDTMRSANAALFRSRATGEAA